MSLVIPFSIYKILGKLISTVMEQKTQLDNKTCEIKNLKFDIKHYSMVMDGSTNQEIARCSGPFLIKIVYN